MLKIIKEFKPYILFIIIIIALLFLQASTELALPDYMSRIVNIGIQQNGIENAVPEAIRKKEMEKIQLFLNDDEKELIYNSYKLVNSENTSGNDYKKYLKKFPKLESESLYILNTDSKEDIDNMNLFLGKAILVVKSIEEGKIGNYSFDNLKKLPREQLDLTKSKIDEQFKDMPGPVINQAAINQIRTQYEEMGVNINKSQSNYIITIGGIMLLFSLISMLASISVGYISARVSSGLGRDLRDKVFSKVAAFSNNEFDEFSTASLITRSTNDVQQVQMFLMLMLRMVFYAPILGAGGVIRALRTNVSMAWIVAVGVGAISILLVTLFIVAMPKFKKVQKLVDKVNLVMRESLNGLMVIRAFNTQKYEEDKFDKANTDLTKTNLFVSRMMVIMMPTMNIIMNGVILLIVWVGAHEIENAHIQVGDMMAFMQYAMQIIMSFLMISMVSVILPRASVSAQRIGEILEKDLSIVDPVKPKELPGKNNGLIEFKNVSFKYNNAEEYVLKDITFTARPGETTAFIGSTGSGKSTLINLIPRFYDITDGEILMDGVDIREIKLKDLRERIGYVPQKGILFSGTIESNLKYGKNASADSDEINKAINIAQAKEFIDLKENGLLSDISQGGTNVSGGQRQRLSIARALAKNSDVLIFDDSFSALDFKTDSSLRKAMKQEIKDRTILIVAQRINTIMNAENIVVLDEGRIVGIGTHKELLKNCDVYKQIALSQLSEEELA